MKQTWKLTSFDTFCLGMNIKSAWIYKVAPDFEKMKAALEKLASMYPHLAGRYDENMQMPKPFPLPLLLPVSGGPVQIIFGGCAELVCMP